MLLLLRWNLQPFTFPDALDPLVVHVPARLVEQSGHGAISVATVSSGQFDDVLSQALFVRLATGHLALRGAVLTQGAAGAALRYAERLSHVVDAFAAT